MVESSNKMSSTGEGNGKPLQYSSLENPMNSMKRQENDTERRTPQLGRCTSGVERINSYRNNEEAEPKQKHTQLRMYLVVKVKSDAVNNNIA